MREKKPNADPEVEVLETIAVMPEPDRVIAERLHEIIKANAPVLAPNSSARR